MGVMPGPLTVGQIRWRAVAQYIIYYVTDARHAAKLVTRRNGEASEPHICCHVFALCCRAEHSGGAFGRSTVVQLLGQDDGVESEIEKLFAHDRDPTADANARQHCYRPFPTGRLRGQAHRRDLCG